jgi:hypothetical protein
LRTDQGGNANDKLMSSRKTKRLEGGAGTDTIKARDKAVQADCGTGADPTASLDTTGDTSKNRQS